MIITSETGSGKTLTYLLPIVNELLSGKRDKASKYKTSCVIVVPNKELSQQIVSVLSVLAGSWRSVVWGGADSTKETVEETLRGKDGEPTFTVGILPGGLKTCEDFAPWRYGKDSGPGVYNGKHADVVVATPTTLGPLSERVER